MMSGTARWWWLAGGAALALWIVTALALAWPTGWVHVFLVAAVGAAVRAIVIQDAEKADQGGSRAVKGGPP